MSPAFLRALARTLSPDFEGGLSNDPADHGGLTNHGITQATYNAWRVTTGQPKRDVSDIGDIEIQAIYFSDYWTPCRCDELPEALAACVFDMAVNSGPFHAKVTLQRALGVDDDGVIGSATLAAAEAQPGAVLAFLEKRGQFIGGLVIGEPTQAKFLGGWIRRLLIQAWEGGKA